MSKSKGKMTFTAEYSGNVVMDNNTSYPGFHMVEHEPVTANKIFEKIHKNAQSGFADCFPPAVSGTRYVLAHRISGTTLASWMINNYSNLILNPQFGIPGYATDLVYLDNNGIPIQMTDMLKLIIQDLGLIVMHGYSSGINLFLDKNSIYISNDQPYRVLAVAESIIHDGGKKIWMDLKSLLDQIWIDCQLINNNETQLISRTFTGDVIMGSIAKFLYSPRFWTKQTRIYSITKLGELVECAKNVVGRNQAHLQVLKNWRAKLSNDQILSTFITWAPPQRVDPSDEVDCLIKFLSDTFSHFSRLRRTGIPFQNKVQMIEYYDKYYPDMMKALYESLGIIEKTLRRA